MRKVLGAAFGMLLIAQILVVTALAVGSPFKGVWTSIDSDGSSQLLTISAGPTPSVVYQDFFASACDRFGGPAAHWVAAGTGEVDGSTLAVSFHKSGCGAFSIGDYDDFWTYDAGSDTLEDSLGIVWSRN